MTQAGSAEAANYMFSTVQPNIGDVAVPDSRLDRTGGNRQIGEDHSDPHHIRRYCRAWCAARPKAKVLGNQFLANIRESDAIVHVVRCFEGGGVTHVESRIDPVSDAETVETELMLSDLESLERRIVSSGEARQDRRQGSRARNTG